MTTRSSCLPAPTAQNSVEISSSIRTHRSTTTVSTSANFIGAGSGAVTVTSSVRVEPILSRHQCVDCKMFKFKCKCKSKVFQKCHCCRKHVVKPITVKDKIFCSKKCCRRCDICPDCGDEICEYSRAECSCYTRTCNECGDGIHKDDKSVEIYDKKTFCNYNCAREYFREDEDYSNYRDDYDDYEEDLYKQDPNDRRFLILLVRCRKCGDKFPADDQHHMEPGVCAHCI